MNNEPESEDRPVKSWHDELRAKITEAQQAGPGPLGTPIKVYTTYTTEEVVKVATTFMGQVNDLPFCSAVPGTLVLTSITTTDENAGSCKAELNFNLSAKPRPGFSSSMALASGIPGKDFNAIP